MARTPRTQNRENPTNIAKSQRSEFGRILYSDCLRGDGRKLTQKQLAEAMRDQGMKVQESVISDLMYHLDHLGYDQAAYDFLYGMFKALNILHVPLTEELVSRFIKAANLDQYHIHISERQQKALFTQLNKELIIKSIYLTTQKAQLIGRDEDIAAVWDMLQKRDVYLLTLIGMPGVGKTELAKQIEEFTKKNDFMLVYFVPLEALVDHTDVLPTIAEYVIQTKKGLTEEEAAGQLNKSLAERHVLLILDNFEHVIAARMQLAELLRNCPQLKILVTSRRSLELGGEYLYPVLPLTLPPLGMYEHLSLKTLMSKYGAIELFVQTAKRRNPSFTLTQQDARLVVQLCHAVDGLPLAINIIAARVKEFGVESI